MRANWNDRQRYSSNPGSKTTKRVRFTPWLERGDDNGSETAAARDMGALGVGFKVRHGSAADTIVDTEVGGENSTKQVLHIHHHLLFSSSEFLKARAKPEWTNECPIDLSNQSVETFNVYANWLYTGVICNQAQNASPPEWRGLIEALILGEYLQDDHFQNTVMDALVEEIRRFSDTKPWSAIHEMVITIYENTTVGSMGRKLMVDLYRNHATELDHSDSECDFPNDFLAELSRALMRQRAETTKPISKIRGRGYSECRYHRHKEGEFC